MFFALIDTMLHSWVVQCVLCYLDDFLLLGPVDSTTCDRSLLSLLDVCNDLGFPVAAEKKEGPSTCITFLGIKIDTVANQLQLPRDKLDQLHAELQSGYWMSILLLWYKERTALFDWHIGPGGWCSCSKAGPREKFH